MEGLMGVRENWEKSLQWKAGAGDRERMLRYGAVGAYVNLWFNNEAGKWQWSVQALEDPEMWLTSFDDYYSVKGFCEKMGWKVLESLCQEGWKADTGFKELPVCPHCGTEESGACDVGEKICIACGRRYEVTAIPTTMYGTKKK
jgi:hypothetical protein